MPAVTLIASTVTILQFLTAILAQLDMLPLMVSVLIYALKIPACTVVKITQLNVPNVYLDTTLPWQMLNVCSVPMLPGASAVPLKIPTSAYPVPLDFISMPTKSVLLVPYFVPNAHQQMFVLWLLVQLETP